MDIITLAWIVVTLFALSALLAAFELSTRVMQMFYWVLACAVAITVLHGRLVRANKRA